jgi:hypothetical protein
MNCSLGLLSRHWVADITDEFLSISIQGLMGESLLQSYPSSEKSCPFEWFAQDAAPRLLFSLFVAPERCRSQNWKCQCGGATLFQ